MFNLADVSPGYSTKVSSQKDMRHPTTNWHSVNSANYPEFVMVLPMATLTRISHESLHTCFAHLYSWPVTELWRDPSQRDSLKFSIRIPTFLWVIPVLSDCTMSLATFGRGHSTFHSRPLVTRLPPQSLDVCEGNSANHSYSSLDVDLWIYSPQIRSKSLLLHYVIWIDTFPLASQKCQHFKIIFLSHIHGTYGEM